MSSTITVVYSPRKAEFLMQLGILKMIKIRAKMEKFHVYRNVKLCAKDDDFTMSFYY